MVRTKQQEYVKGSMTIEITFIMPIIIGIIIMFCYIWLFLYNSYVLEQSIERAIVDFEKEWELTTDEIKESIEEQIEDELNSGLLALDNCYATAEVSIFSIQVIGGYTMKVSLATFLEQLIGSPLFAKEYVGSIQRENSITLIRIYRKLQELYSGIGDGGDDTS